MDKIIGHLVTMLYVDHFLPKFLQSRCCVWCLLVHSWHMPLHYPHGANGGCDFAGAAPASNCQYPLAISRVDKNCVPANV